MKARDIMHADIVAVGPETSILDAAKLMLERNISGLLVMDGGNLLGIVTEGDLVRRTEIDTEKRRSRFAEFFAGPGKLARDYVRASGRKVHQIMTREVESVADTADVRDVVERMEQLRVKRLPVKRGNAVVGVISRADILRAFLQAADCAISPPLPDDEIRTRLVAHLEKQNWSSRDLVKIAVHDGVVTMEGVVLDPLQIEAFEVAAENIPGVKKVNDRMIWIDPIYGSAYDASGRFFEPGQG
jgi:CBS domain-containing protein